MKTTLRDLRKQVGKTAAEVAAALGVTASAYYNYEKGWRRIGLEEVLILADFFEVSAEEVILAQLESGRRKNGRS